MLRQETIRSFLGFGDNKMAGEIYYSQGMRWSGFGIKPDWRLSDSISSTTLAALTLLTFFAQRTETSTVYNFGLGNTGKLFKVEQNLNTWTEVSGITTTGYGNGLGVDTESNIIIAGRQYLCKISPANPNVITNNWKDLGSDEITMWRPIERYEDTTLIGNKNKIATYTGDGSDFAADTLEFPAGFVINNIKSGQGGILIGMNFGNWGVLALWDNYSDRAITPWIWFDEPIYSIAKYKGQWIVAVGDEFIITNGYTYNHLCFAPDSKIYGTRFVMEHSPGCMTVKDNYLIVAGGQGEVNRRQQGIWIYNLDIGLWNFCPVSNGVTENVSIGGILSDDAFNFFVSYQTSSPAKRYIGKLYTAMPAKAYFITLPWGTGDNKKTAEGLLLNFGFDMVNSNYEANPAITIKAGISDCKRQLWNYGQTRAVSTNKKILKVDGSYSSINKAEVGDEITVLEGTNAGESRYLVSIANPGTNTEEWTVDSDFSNLTESTVYLNISPFKKITSVTVSTAEIKEEGFYLPIESAPVGKKFMVKIAFVIAGNNMVPEITSMSLIYNDLGFN